MSILQLKRIVASTFYIRYIHTKQDSNKSAVQYVYQGKKEYHNE